MSGSSTGRAPRSDAEWARDITQRVRALEQQRTTRVGSWTLLDLAGSLIAAKVGKQVDLGNPVATATTVAKAVQAHDFWSDLTALGNAFWLFLRGQGTWADVVSAWNQLMTDLTVNNPTSLQFWRSWADLLLGQWTSTGFTTAFGDLVNTYGQQLVGSADQQQLDAAWRGLFDSADTLQPGTFWRWFLDSTGFALDVSRLVTVFFNWLFGQATTADLKEAWDRVVADLADSTQDFWRAITDVLVGSWTSPEFSDALADLIIAYFAHVTEPVGSGSGPVGQIALDAAWDAAWNAADNLSTSAFWRWALNGIKFLNKLSALVDTFFKFLAGHANQAQLTAAWNEATDALLITRPDMSQFWDQMYDAWINPSNWWQNTLEAGNEALENWAVTMDNLLGSGVHVLEDLVAWWEGVLDAANNAQQTADVGLENLRRHINYVLQGFSLGYLNTSWAWVTGTASSGDLPTSTPAITPAVIQSWVPGLVELRKQINYMLQQLGLGYLNSSWVWTAGVAAAGDLPASTPAVTPAVPGAWIDDVRKQINYMLQMFGLGYLNTSWVWTTGTAGTGDLPSARAATPAVAQSWINNVSGWLTTDIAARAQISDLITHWVGGGTTLSGNAGLTQIIADVKALLGGPSGLGTGVPSAGIAGGSVPDAIQSLTNSIVSGLSELAGDYGFPDVANALNNLVGQHTKNVALTQSITQTIATAALTNPLHHAVDPTLQASIPLAWAAGSTITVDQITSTIGFIIIQTTATVSSFVWYGGGTTSLSGCYASLSKMNTSDGSRTRLWLSSNIIGIIGPDLDWNYADFDTPIDVAQGDVLAAELQFSGTGGTHTMVGLPNHALDKPNPRVKPAQLAASRVSENTPTFRVAGAANTGTGSATEAQTATAGDYALAVVVAYNAAPSGCTYDGQPMSPIVSVGLNNGTSVLTIYGRANVPGGTKNVVASTTAGHFITLNSMVFPNVQSAVSAATPTYGIANTATISATGTAGSIVVAALAAYGGLTGVTMGFTGGTQRIYYDPGVANEPSYIAGESSATGPLTFSSALSSSTYWGAAAVRLYGTPILAPASAAEPTYSTNVPFLAVSSLLGEAQGRTYLPVQQNWTSPDSYTAPVWSKYLDWVGVGAGGSGEGEIGINMGTGGRAGSWNGVTLTAGVHYTPGVTVFTVTPGDGGASIVGYFANGNPGDASTVTWTDPTSTPRSFTCAGGLGGQVYQPGWQRYDGEPAGDYTFNGVPYYGGGGAIAGTNGVAPGSGGGGAIIFQPWSGAGAPGKLFVTARQS